MELINCKIETSTKYHQPPKEETGGYHIDYGTSYDVIEITIPLPGGLAKYEIPLSKQQRDSIELAIKLAANK